MLRKASNTMALPFQASLGGCGACLRASRAKPQLSASLVIFVQRRNGLLLRCCCPCLRRLEKMSLREALVERVTWQICRTGRKLWSRQTLKAARDPMAASKTTRATQKSVEVASRLHKPLGSAAGEVYMCRNPLLWPVNFP